MDWMAEGWRYLLDRATTGNAEEPPWLDRPAIGRTAVSGWRIYELFDQLNASSAYAAQVKPFNFLNVAFPRRGERDASERVVLVAPFESDPERWLEMGWIDRYTGDVYRITTNRSEGRVRPGLVEVRTYRDILDYYLVHLEPKSLAPDGTPCRPPTSGLLRRRPLTPTHITHIGKEANSLDDVEAGLVRDLVEVANAYADAERDLDTLRNALREIGTREVARRAGLGHSTVSAFLQHENPSTPRAAALDKLHEVARTHQRSQPEADESNGS